MGHSYKEEIKKFLLEKGKVVLDVGCHDTQRTDYPLYAKEAAHAVVQNRCAWGILVCGTGVGMALAANQITGIRAVVGSDPYTVRLSREHNDTNVLTLGARVLGIEFAKMIVTNWLDVPFEGGRHQRRITLFESMREPTDENRSSDCCFPYVL